MKIGQLTCDVRVGSTGFTRSAGMTIAESEVAPALWQTWVEQGIVVLPSLDVANRRERARVRRRKSVIK